MYNDIPDWGECGMRQTEKKGETLMGSARNLSIGTIGSEMIIALNCPYKTQHPDS